MTNSKNIRRSLYKTWSIFVGRSEEIQLFKKVLEAEEGMAALICGPSGIGKSVLSNRLARLSVKHPKLTCGFIVYSVVATQSPQSIIELMLEDAYQSANLKEGSFAKTSKRSKQWQAFFSLIPKGKAIFDAFTAIRDIKARPFHEIFIDKLNIISEKMTDTGRALFVLDSDKYMMQGSEDLWRKIVRDLPPKIKIVFAQRHDDVLAADSEFRNSPNVICIPSNGLNALEEINVDELIRVHPAITKYKFNDLKRAISTYAGHPYACVAALDMLLDGLALSDLPIDPTPTKIAETQLNRIYRCGDEIVVNLFKTYAVINHPTYDELIEKIIGISKHKIKYIRRSNPFVNGLLKKTPGGYGIYHTLLSDYILSEMNDDEINELRALIALNYKSCIQSNDPQCDIAARFLGPLIFNIEGADSFVKTFLEISAKPLIDFGFLQEAFDQIKLALEFVSPNSIDKARLHRLLGNIYYLKGEHVDSEREYTKAILLSSNLDYFEGLANSYGNLGVLYCEQKKYGKAKSMHLRSFKVEHRLKRAYGMAADLGNIGLVFLKQGKIKIAEKYFIKSLKINKQINRPEGVAKQYENLGVLHREIGEYSRAKMMHQRALEIEIELDRVEGIGRNYKSIGEIYRCLGRSTEACDAFIKAKRIYEKAGMNGEVRYLEKVIEKTK